MTSSEDRLPDRLEPVSNGVEVERPPGQCLEEKHRLVAKALVGVGDERRRPGGGCRPASRAPHRRPTPHLNERALEQPIETLPARIDDTCIPQDRQERRRPGNRLLGGLDGRGQDDLDVVRSLGGDDGCLGRLTDDRQDRSFDRFGDGAIGRLRADRQGVGEIEAVEAGLAPQTVGHPPEDLAGDHPRVAAGSHERPEADRRRDPLCRHVGDSLGLVEGGPDGREHVRACVAVRYRVDIQAVDLGDMRLEIVDGALEGLEQTGAVTRSAGHQATSVPLAARSSAATSLGSGGAAAAGRSPGWNRSPLTWMVNRPISTSRARRTA